MHELGVGLMNSLVIARSDLGLEWENTGGFVWCAGIGPKMQIYTTRRIPLFHRLRKITKDYDSV